MQHRMNVPETYQPKLPKKVAAYVAAQQQKASEAEGQTIWYQCVDRPDCWAQNGHKSHTQAGVVGLGSVLTDPANAGALMVTFEDNRRFSIQDGTLRPA